MAAIVAVAVASAAVASANAAAVTRPADTEAEASRLWSARYAALLVTLDALVDRARADGGWTFAVRPGHRFRPHTSPLRFAERVAAPFGLADWDVVVVRSPGTPAAILALLAGYRLTGRERYLDAAVRAGDLLVAIQMQSGGWFSEMPVAGAGPARWFELTVRRSAIDDDVTPGAVRALLALHETMRDPRYRVAAEHGLVLLLDRQLAGGAWPLVARPRWKQLIWRDFEDAPTLNDGATTQTIVTLLAAARTLGRDDLITAARRGSEWILRAQRPPPQAGWAQQYDADGKPAPARRYERIALASWETRYAIDALLALAAATGEVGYCAGVVDAARWLASSRLGPGCWARFYELGSNAPLYFNEKRQVVMSPAEAHQPYDWTGDFGIPDLLRRVGIEDGDDAAADARDAEPTSGAMGSTALHLTARLPGDPGGCPHPGGTPFDPRTAVDPRHVIAYAGRLLAALEPPPPSPCRVQ